LRIAYVVSSYHPQVGGVETHVRHLAEGCAQAGDQVTVLTHQVGDSRSEERIGEVQICRFPPTVSSQVYPVSLHLFRHLRSHAADFDLVHAHSYHTLVGHAAYGTSLPLVFTPHYHGTGHTPFRAFLHRFYRPLGARVFREADAVICVSEAERDLLIKDFPAIAPKIVTIPNGVEAKTPLPGRDDAMPTEPVVLTVGRLERYKNIDLIIDAFQGLSTPAALVVVGDGPDRPRLERRAAAGASCRPVIFTGRISDKMLERWFGNATVIASASDHEAFGITLADGLASGVRVVASDIPAHAALARMAGAGSAIALVNPRATLQFTGQLAASLLAGRIQAGELKLPSWAEVVADTRDLYSQVRLQDHLADQRGPDMLQPPVTFGTGESPPVGSA
jgi:glycosyltransferase involved in cell wall biosynthesis